MRDHFLLLPMLVVLEGLGVLVPEIVVHNGVQPRSVEVHVFLGVLLVWHLCAGCLQCLQLLKSFLDHKICPKKSEYKNIISYRKLKPNVSLFRVCECMLWWSIFEYRLGPGVCLIWGELAEKCNELVIGAICLPQLLVPFICALV